MRTLRLMVETTTQVLHVWEHFRSDQYMPLCTMTGEVLVLPDGRRLCVACVRKLLDPTV